MPLYIPLFPALVLTTTVLCIGTPGNSIGFFVLWGWAEFLYCASAVSLYRSLRRGHNKGAHKE